MLRNLTDNEIHLASQDRTSVEIQSEDRRGIYGKQKEAYMRPDESACEVQKNLQVRQHELLKALTPLPHMLETNKSEILDFVIFPTNSIIYDLQAPPPQIFESTETNSRYKDIPELFSLFEKHGSHSDSYDSEENLSDVYTLSSILNNMRIPDNA
jgi:hypothetical protein